MRDEMTVLEIIEKTTARRNARRAFMRASAGAVVAAGGLSMLAACNNEDDDDNSTVGGVPAPTPTPSASAIQDTNVLNLALNLEYLEAQFYSWAVFGRGLDAGLLTGLGTQGAVADIGAAGGPRQVTFTDPVIAEYAREIAYDEIAHVAFLRTALGSSAQAQPALNISGNATGAFTAAARAAGVVPSTGTFDPYASENNFLLGAYIFEDVGVTAYKGAAPLITNKTFLEAAAGILAAEAYHAGLVRTILYARGVTVSMLRTAAGQISDARDSLDGPTDLDQGITGTATASNLVPTDANGLAFSRSAEQVHNIVYLNNRQVTSGGFFPAGTNNADPALRRSGNFA
jgi:hypothetical protein